MVHTDLAQALEEALALEYGEPATPELLLNARELRAYIRHLLLTLPPIEERVLRMWHGLGGISEMSIEEIGDTLSMPGSKVRFLKDKAHRRLQRPMQLRKLAHRCGEWQPARIVRTRYGYDEQEAGRCIFDQSLLHVLAVNDTD